MMLVSLLAVNDCWILEGHWYVVQ